ncbi:MAG TPA: hypothetical protein VF624_10245, partial [Tepidisphaeraceae bacterium]
DLALPVAAICSKVEIFGVYTPMERAQFAAGTPSKFVIYTEVENFSSQLNPGGKWETKLSLELNLYTESGFAAIKPIRLNFSDSSRARRRDFFLCRLIELPGNLNVGPYTVKLTVIDQDTNRVAETSVPMEIIAGAP